MSRMLRPLLFVLQFAVVGLAAAFVIGKFWPNAGPNLRARLAGDVRPASAVAQAPPAPRASSPVSSEDAVARTSPAVRNIYAAKIETKRPFRLFPHPLMQRI